MKKLLTIKLFALFCLFITTKLGAKDLEFDLHNFVDSGTYYGAYIGKQKIGYGFTQAQIVERNSIDHFQIAGTFFMEFASDDDLSTTEIKYEYVFSSENQNHLVSYTESSDDRTYINMSDLNENNYKERELSSLSASYLGNGTYKILTDGEHDKKQQIIKLPVLTAIDFLAAEYLAQRSPEKGNIVEILVGDIDFAEAKPISMQHKILNIGRYGPSDNEFVYYEIQSIMDDISYEKIISQLDEFGTAITSSFFGIDLKPEPESVAKNNALDRNLYSLGTIHLTNPLVYEGEFSEIILELHGGALRENFIANDRQSLLENNNDYSLIKVVNGQSKIPTSSNIAIEDFLKYDAKYNWQSPLITSLNQSLDMSNLDEEQKVKYLLDFTHNYIEYDFTLSASIDEIVLNKKGDCTEYAQLFITLARLNGIPSKEVSGLVYNYDEDEPGFSQHAWVEVWLNGGWTEVDPGWDEFNVDATHIQLSDDYYFGFDDKIQIVSYQ